MADYILDYNEYLNESLNLMILAKDSIGKLTVAINNIVYEYYTHSPYIIEQFEKRMRNSHGQALSYLKGAVGDNYKKIGELKGR